MPPPMVERGDGWNRHGRAAEWWDSAGCGSDISSGYCGVRDRLPHHLVFSKSRLGACLQVRSRDNEASVPGSKRPNRSCMSPMRTTGEPRGLRAGERDLRAAAPLGVRLQWRPVRTALTRQDDPEKQRCFSTTGSGWGLSSRTRPHREPHAMPAPGPIIGTEVHSALSPDDPSRHGCAPRRVVVSSMADVALQPASPASRFTIAHDPCRTVRVTSRRRVGTSPTRPSSGSNPLGATPVRTQFEPSLNPDRTQIEPRSNPV